MLDIITSLNISQDSSTDPSVSRRTTISRQTLPPSVLLKTADTLTNIVLRALVLSLSVLSANLTYASETRPNVDLSASAFQLASTSSITKSSGSASLELDSAWERDYARQQKHARWWWWGWMSGLSVAAGTMITMATLEKGDTPESLAQKESNYVSTGFAFLGLLSTGLARPKSINIFDELNAMPETTPAQILAKKQRARELKNLDIAQAKRGNSWLAHAIPAVLASIAGTSLAIRHEDPWIGLKSFALTVIVTEIRIGLRPEFSESSTSERAGVFSSPLIDTLSVVPYYPNDGAGQGLSLVGRF